MLHLKLIDGTSLHIFASTIAFIIDKGEAGSVITTEGGIELEVSENKQQIRNRLKKAGVEIFD